MLLSRVIVEIQEHKGSSTKRTNKARNKTDKASSSQQLSQANSLLEGKQTGVREMVASCSNLPCVQMSIGSISEARCL